MRKILIAGFLLCFSVKARATPATDLETRVSSLTAITAQISQKITSLTTHLNSAVTDFNSQLATLRMLTNVSASTVLDVGVITASAGATVTVPVFVMPGPFKPSALQMDVVIPSSVTFVSAVIGAAGTAAGKQLQASAVGGSVRLIIFGLNQTAIGQGTLANLQFKTAASIPKGNYPLTVSNPSSSDGSGAGLPIATVSGILIIK